MKKKVIALICAATILCGMIVPAAGNTSQPETKEANIFDVLEILKDMIGISKLDSVEMYDVNDDGVIDIFDALMILKGLVKLQTPVMILLAPREKITVTSSFNVTGMDCIGCENGLKTILLKIKGVVNVSVSWSTGKVEVVHESWLNADAIINKILDAGFTVQQILPKTTTTPETTTAEPTEITTVITVCGIDLCCSGPLINLLNALNGVISVSVASAVPCVEFTIIHEPQLSGSSIQAFITGKGYSVVS